MNIAKQVEELQVEFEDEFMRTINQLDMSYPRFSKGKYDEELTKDTSKVALGTILINILRQVQVDCTQMVSTDFHYKYFPNLPILDCSDFTNEEKHKIINETHLKDRDKAIAIKLFIENKTIEDIYAEMSEIGDKKTIKNNIDKISELLKHTALLHNQKNHH